MPRRLAARTATFAAVGALAALTACNGDTPAPRLDGSTPPVTSAPPVTTTPSATTATSSPAATASASATPSGTMTVPVYYLGPDALLYREFRSVPRSTGVVRAAVDAMLHVTPLDPDYRSLWPRATTVRGISVSGTVATVDLSAAARTNPGAGSQAERQSLQQLVYTVTAAAPSLTGVRLRFDGRTEPTLWGHASTTGTLSRGPQSDVLGRVWVTSPGQLTTVGRSFTVKGTATVFEGTVSWSLRRLSGAAIADGSAQATTGAPGRGDWSVTVTIPAGVTGDVVFKAWESSARDGSVLYPDDKRWHVR